MADVETLHSRLYRRPIVVAPGVYDAFTALVAAQAGFATLYLSGAAIAYTELGRPEVGLVSMSEVADKLARIRDRVDADLIVDADNGYGNALNVARMVRLFERMGADAIQLEDQDFPKRCGHLSGKSKCRMRCRMGTSWCRTRLWELARMGNNRSRNRAFSSSGITESFG